MIEGRVRLVPEPDQRGNPIDSAVRSSLCGAGHGIRFATDEGETQVKEVDTVFDVDPATQGRIPEPVIGWQCLARGEILQGEVLEIAKRIPAQRFGGAVEVRPIVEYER